ncbi:KRI1-like family C-terminal-domain-containing protein [Cubamyces lactineus]|nr:KRI1-like family C-terminal-domain-containing protein [Cubamyces lactineus]
MLSDDSDVEDIHTLTINEHYAKAFEYRKEREELAKLKEKYGSDVDEDEEDDEDSEEAESEDEDGEELTPAVDAAILRTLARIKRKDPSIYEQGKDIFEEEKQRTQDVQISRRANKDKSKPVTMRQHALASALEGAQSRSPSPQPLTHMEEQEELRKETISAFHTAVKPGDDVEEDDFLVPREKTKDEIEQEEEEYRAFLQREVGEDLTGLVTVDPDSAGILDGADEEEQVGGKKKKAKQEKQKEKKPAKNKQEEDQEFLMNYILNRGWIDKSARRLPTYKEITGSQKGKGKSEAGSDSEASGSESDEDRHSNEDGPNALDDDDFDEVADRFESSYNFRFEEPGAADIARYPRNIPDVVRRQDTARKEAREKKKARKEEELLKKKEEVKRLKALKMKELRAKLERIGHEGGKKLEETEALQELDLEGEWDPSKHDQQMAKIFANDSIEDGDVDEEKPQWDDDIDIGDIVPPEAEDGDSKKKKKKKKKKKDEDGMGEGGVDIDEMDAEVERPPADEEEWDGTEEMRKRKLEEYMDEIYGLDFNDMVAGMPTRFKYTKVEPQNFGLTPAEILMATDAELNSYMGVKKLAPYRKEGKGRTWDSKRAARLKELKTKLKERGVSGSIEAVAAAQEKKKRKGKKERMREKAMAAASAGEGENDGGNEERDGGEDHDAQKNGRKRKSEEVEEQQEGGEASAKKRRRRHKKSAATAAAS